MKAIVTAVLLFIPQAVSAAEPTWIMWESPALAGGPGGRQGRYRPAGMFDSRAACMAAIQPRLEASQRRLLPNENRIVAIPTDNGAGFIGGAMTAECWPVGVNLQ